MRARSPSAQWLVRIEDADVGRCLPGMDEHILAQLAACGMHPDRPPVRQTQRMAQYQGALDRLIACGRAYPCACSRKDIEAELARRGVTHDRHGERVYPGTCRSGLHGRPARAWRFAVVPLDGAAAAERTSVIDWTDRRLGPQQQDVATDIGDFVLRRADGVWAYQLAVVVDDADQRISDVVRGEDLTDNTARQIALQRALGMPTPTYLHTPLVLAADGQKLSKQNGAQPIDTSTPSAALAALVAAAHVLGLPTAHPSTATGALASWIPAWRDLYNSRP